MPIPENKSGYQIKHIFEQKKWPGTDRDITKSLKGRATEKTQQPWYVYTKRQKQKLRGVKGDVNRSAAITRDTDAGCCCCCQKGHVYETREGGAGPSQRRRRMQSARCQEHRWRYLGLPLRPGSGRPGLTVVPAKWQPPWARGKLPRGQRSSLSWKFVTRISSRPEGTLWISPWTELSATKMSSETLLWHARPDRRPRSSSKRGTRLAKTNGSPRSCGCRSFLFWSLKVLKKRHEHSSLKNL